MAQVKSEEELILNQRKELRELHGRIQSIKRSIPKGDKKRKKEVTAEITVLEAELAAKHERELHELNSTVNVEKVEVENSVENSSIQPEVSSTVSQKISKAQKRRSRKADKAKEREQAIAEQEIDNLTGARNLETGKLGKILSDRGLVIHEVPSDGDCLYKAVEHQLETLDLQQTTVKQLRKETSDYMLFHKDDFCPFLTDPGSGDALTDDQYDKYCKDIASKHAWGGQVEIQALSHVCEVPIEVIQADGPSVSTGENYKASKLLLSYHRHMYGLGEHYNSVVKSKEEKDDA